MRRPSVHALRAVASFQSSRTLVGRSLPIDRPALSTVVLVLVASLVVAGTVGPVVAASGPAEDGGVTELETADAIDSTGLDTETVSATNDTEAVFADDPDELEAVVDDVMADQRSEHDIPGATVAVVEGDETVLTKGYGEADAAAGTPVRANETSFVVGSVGKLVTWTAVMRGVEDGVLDLDEDVNTYLEESDVDVPDTYDEPVTLRHLGTHTDGFDATPSGGIVTDAAEVTSLETALVENQPERVRPPGETPSYSNYGAMLAGHVVAEAYDTTFEEYVQSELFEPLEMDHSTFAQPVPEDHPGELATPHATTGDGVETVDRTYVNWRPAGSMSTTSTDMATFMSAHLEDGAVDDARILEGDTVATMHDTHYERHPDLNGWRYGFYEYGPADAELLAHSGGTMHETSKLVLVPEADVGIFVSYNIANDAAPPSDVVDEILAEYDLPTDPDGVERGADDGATDRTATVAGEYRTTMLPQNGPMQVLDPMTRLSVDATDDGRLESETLGANEQEWVETEPYVFREVDGDDVLVFDVENGEVDALHANSAPMMTYEPVATHEQTLVVGATVGGALLGFVLSTLGWVGLAAWRGGTRWRRRASDQQPSQTESKPLRGQAESGLARGSLRERLSRRLGNPAWLARAVGGALCVVSLALVGAFLWGVGTGGEYAFVTMTTPIRIALGLAPLVGLLAVATAIGAGLAWANGYWSRRARVHQTMLAVLGLAFTWFLLQFGLLGA